MLIFNFPEEVPDLNLVMRWVVEISMFQHADNHEVEMVDNSPVENEKINWVS